MKSQIIDELKRIEDEYDVTVLYACESGSRVWGFDNEESDYDIRFIFKKNNLNEYLKLSDSFDVIDYTKDNLDLVGWDVSKALKLHFKDNPNLREWLLSPIKYIDWQEDIFRYLPTFSGRVLKFHYYNIASNNWKTISDLNIELTRKVIKMYLHNCRCILSWIAVDLGKYSSINIFDLLDEVEIVDVDIKRCIGDLATYYRNNCRGNLDFEIIEKLNSWNRDMLFFIKNIPPKKEYTLPMMEPVPKRDRDIWEYDRRLFEILLPDYDRYLEWKKSG
jgi:hypothetical protein